MNYWGKPIYWLLNRLARLSAATCKVWSIATEMTKWLAIRVEYSDRGRNLHLPQPDSLLDQCDSPFNKSEKRRAIFSFSNTGHFQVTIFMCCSHDHKDVPACTCTSLNMLSNACRCNWATGRLNVYIVQKCQYDAFQGHFPAIAVHI